MPHSPTELALAVLFVGVGLVVVALLVNRFASEHRSRLKAPLMLWLTYGLATLVLGAARQVGATPALPYLEFIAKLVGGFCTVNLATLLLADVLLPRVYLRVPAIAADLVSALGYGAVLVAVATSAGLDATSAFAGGTVVAAALTISLQSTLGNVIGGVALQLDGTVQVGDWVQLEGGRQGYITAIRWRHTLVETRDGDAIVLPNATLLSTPITLLGRRGGQPHPHRQWVYFRVDHRVAPEVVVRMVEDALRASPLPGCAPNHPPDVLCTDLGKDPLDSTATYAARYWLLDLMGDARADSEARERIHVVLQRAGIPLALPAHTVFNAGIAQLGAEAQRVRRAARAYEVIRTVELFRTLTDEECHKLAPQLAYRPFASGEVIARQGALAHHLYLLASGKVDVTLTTPDGREQTIATLTGPDFFGEMGLLTGAPRSANIVATTAVDCFQLDRADFEGILRAREDVAAELAAFTAARQMALTAAREGLNAADRGAEQLRETARILAKMREFFGLGG
jgi:CRP-like cAMP-binding protein/small-conductance mechanosensitive channel